MKISAHLDPWVLERELVARVDAAHPRSAAAATLVLVPTNRLADHLQRRLVERRPAWLGLEILPFRRLAGLILDQAGGTAPEVVSRLLLEALLQGVLREQPRNVWSKFVASRPGALRGLLGAMSDLREAGIDPDDVEACCSTSERGRDLAQLYRSCDHELAGLASRGWTDDAGLIRAALPMAAAFGRRCETVFVHGVYELLGVHLDLLRELDRVTAVELLLPASPGSPVSRYADSFASEFLAADGATVQAIERSDSPPGRPALPALYDEEHHPEPAGPEHFSFRHTQGAATEVRVAVREALLAVRDGCPPTEIAIVARSLEPYAAAIEEIFDEENLPWTSSLGSPLRRHPVVRDFLLLLAAVGDGFPRGKTAELLRSPRLRWEDLPGISGPPPGEAADGLSREAGLIGGLDEWTDMLPGFAARPETYPGQSEEGRARAESRARKREEEAREVGRAVEAIGREVDPAARRWSEHAERLGRLLGTVFHEPEDGPASAALGTLRELIDEMRLLESAVGDRRRVAFDTMCAWLEEAVDGSELQLRRKDDGGLRVLDSMQLRGLTFRQVHLLGLNSGLTPRTPREDPILTESMRRALREQSGRPLGVKAAGTEEERLLLALGLGAASDRVDVSWQRADESGKAKTPSLALREIARLAFGTPNLERLRKDARHLRSHPAQWLEDIIKVPGLLTPGEERMLGALHGHDREAAAELGRRFPELGPGLEMLRATQSFAPGDGRYDARVGPLPGAATYSVSRLETLGTCPLQYFFREVLAVDELDEPASSTEVTPLDVGNRIHALLEETYRALDAQGLFQNDPSEELIGRADAMLDAGRDRILGDLGHRQSRRLPVLWEHWCDRWIETLRAFARTDLGQARREGLTPEAFEQTHEQELDLGNEVTVRVRGRFDRCMRGPAGRRIVGDYKTSKSLDWRADPTAMLKARTLQLPLYWMMTGREATVELLGIHPDLDPAEARPAFAGFDKPELLESFLETLRTLLGLREAGSFPFDADKHCEWCSYVHACRRHHPPTLERESRAEHSREFHRLRGKSTRKPDGR